ncbi:unnamed protein product [Adineta steineri]|uniref:Uncharacterized protein n=1 Tax=Adineta steineri TaxID=433720 RepID=A0A814CMQ8_9BILA|nr:unnamed protein product [Adineta steineri]
MVDQWNFVYSYDLYWKACAPAYCTYSDSVHTNNFVGILIIMISMIGGLMAALRLIIPPVVNFVCGLFTPKKTFDKPSFNVYNGLVKDHGDTLQCQCSSISSTYNQYVQLEPIFHQICSSTFASNEWRENLTAKLIPDLSIYDIRDYRRFLSAHLQFLNGLCQLSIQAINDSVDQFLSSTLASAQIIPETVFRLEINSLINDSQSNAPMMFARLLFLLRTTNHGNAIISAYGNNFKYIVPWDNQNGNIAITEAMTYDNECSCGLDATCTTQASFMNSNSSETVAIKGLKMGCTPSESFLGSTLECFYDSSCINLIQKYKKLTNTVQPINSIDMTTTATINAISDPTNVQGVNINLKLVPITATTENRRLSSLLRWLKSAFWFILLMIAAVIMIGISFYFIRQGQNQIVSTVSTCQLTFQPIVSYAASGDSSYALAVSDFNSDGLLDFAVALYTTYAMDVFLGNGNETFKQPITGPTIASYYFPYFLSSNDLSYYDLAHYGLSYDDLVFNDILVSFVIADFNNDGHLDLAAYSAYTYHVVILFGSANGTFAGTTMLSNSALYAEFSRITPSIGVGDLNNDGIIDIVIAYDYQCTITTLFGYGNGNFTSETTLWQLNSPCLPSILIADFNDDSKQDIAVSMIDDCQVVVMLANGNGSFDASMTFSTGLYSFPRTIAANDFNDDGYLDIVVTNTGNHNIGVLLGKGNGDFQAQITSTTKVTFPPTEFVVGDFNGDGHLDIVTTVQPDAYYLRPWLYGVIVLPGYGNGSFGDPITVGTGTILPSLVDVGDFNSDGRIDIIVNDAYGISVGILFNTCACC